MSLHKFSENTKSRATQESCLFFPYLSYASTTRWSSSQPLTRGGQCKKQWLEEPPGDSTSSPLFFSFSFNLSALLCFFISLLFFSFARGNNGLWKETTSRNNRLVGLDLKDQRFTQWDHLDYTRYTQTVFFFLFFFSSLFLSLFFFFPFLLSKNPIFFPFLIYPSILSSKSTHLRRKPNFEADQLTSSFCFNFFFCIILSPHHCPIFFKKKRKKEG